MSVSYLLILLVVIGCMALIDRKFRLFFWKDPRRASIVMAVGLVFFIAWDLLGIYLGIFFRGETSYMTGILLARELPLEEPFFLVFLSYLIMVLITGIELTMRRVRERRS
ncbi:lycopene cyclase domain-containing protein [Cryobacterium sp. CG_9.6]|uniref:lycopene cyclase domain-containing protein n=1 Tax=Cryobacterium sp. CG_9.6 TaxID=2760710 RepID=UPI0024751DB1|nr:lycopene cyclase domain-containing protein [Cryobacterium sp. CG_9.6]MDH6237987.1 lycopene cyclase domain-containing protein [Cryobacterium sp. CG_9.6]